MRPLAWLAVLALVIAWIAMPSTDAAQVAVQRIPALLNAAIEGSERSLADQLLDGAVTEASGEQRLALAGVRLTVPGIGSQDLTIHIRARRALVAALRQRAAMRGLALGIEGEKTAVQGASSVLFTLSDGQLSARVQTAPGTGFGASIPAPPSDRRALLPGLLAAALVILWRRPLVALACGLVLGTGLLVAARSRATPVALEEFPLDFARLLFAELREAGAWQPIATILALLATWAITARNGGLGGWATWLAARAKNPRRAQLLTWASASSLFFEAPGKNVALGWALRTSSVRARLSSEKFAWLLDSMGTAMLGLCLLSPWTGYAFQQAAALGGSSASAGELWLATLPWRSFCWLTLALGLIVALSGRDFGTMLAAERRSREGLGPDARGARRVFAAPEPDPRTALQAWRAMAPFAVYALALLVQALRDGGALAGGFDPGSIANWLDFAVAMNRPDTSMIAALAALLVALMLSSIAGAERGVPAALLRGLRAALRPCALILGAWALGSISTRLGAGEVLAATLGDRIAPTTLPAILFLASAAGAFCFGSALAALPMFLPLACGLAGALGMDFQGGPAALMVISLAAVLEGTLAGALVSPLCASSLSASIGAGADHADHVRTQAPYALLTMTGLLLAFLAAGLFGAGAWSALAIAAIVQFGVFAWLSRSSQRIPASI